MGADDTTLLTIQETAALLKMERHIVSRSINDGVLPSIKLGPRSVRIPAWLLRETLTSLAAAVRNESFEGLLRAGLSARGVNADGRTAWALELCAIRQCLEAEPRRHDMPDLWRLLGGVGMGANVRVSSEVRRRRTRLHVPSSTPRKGTPVPRYKTFTRDQAAQLDFIHHSMLRELNGHGEPVHRYRRGPGVRFHYEIDCSCGEMLEAFTARDALTLVVDHWRDGHRTFMTGEERERSPTEVSDAARMKRHRDKVRGAQAGNLAHGLLNICRKTGPSFRFRTWRSV